MEGVIVGVNVIVLPTSTDWDAGSDMLVGSMGWGFTVTVQDADKPFDVVTVIVDIPVLTPLTTPEEPEEETVATLVLLDFHVSVVVALEGVSVGVNVMVFPTTTDRDEGSDMPVGSTGVFTVIS